MRNPVRSEADAFHIAMGCAVVIAAALVLGSLLGVLVGVALLVGAVGGAVFWELAAKDPDRRRPLREAASAAPARTPTAARRVLVVANRTLQGEELRAELRRRAADGPEFHIVAPILCSRIHYIASDVDSELGEARQRLADALAWAQEEGVAATGRVGDPNAALGAIEDELRRHGADEVIISTYPRGTSNWLETGIVERLRDELEIPITHVVVEPTDRGQRMFASMRRYRLERGTMDELARRIDEDFAEQLAAQPGFVSYEFINCGFGEFMTMSVFFTLRQAEASRELARRWAEEHRDEFEFPRLEAAHGEILVGRAAEGMLEESHVGSSRKSVAIARYRVRQGSVDDLMRKVDGVFADRFLALDGFEAWHVFECGPDEFLWIAFVRDFAVAEESDAWASRFIREELREFGLEPMSAARGELIVSRTRTELLEPAHT